MNPKVTVALLILLVLLPLTAWIVKEKFINTNDPGPAPVVYSPLRDYFPPGRPHLNFCLTGKPVGNYKADPRYLWWKDGHKDYHTKLYQSCGPYGCSTEELNGETARGLVEQEMAQEVDLTGRVPQEYYQDSEAYCQANPKDQLCPNHWL